MFSLGNTKSKGLIAIICCHHRAGHTGVIRETWVADIQSRIDYRFFYGRGTHSPIQSDETILECDDAYRGLACKVQEICKWALTNGYEWVFKVDDDTYVRPERVVRAHETGTVTGDYQGRKLGPTDHYHLHPYARGGTGYWLSKKAMEILASAPTPNPDIPSEYAEDSWVGKTLMSKGIDPTDDLRLRCSDSGYPWREECPTKYNQYITLCEFLGEKMRPVHQEWILSCRSHTDLMGRLRIQ